MTENEPGRRVALTAEAQQIRVQVLRQIQFAVDHVMERLLKGDLEEILRRTQLLPELSCARVGVARFRRRVAFDGD